MISRRRGPDPREAIPGSVLKKIADRDTGTTQGVGASIKHVEVSPRFWIEVGQCSCGAIHLRRAALRELLKKRALCGIRVAASRQISERALELRRAVENPLAKRRQRVYDCSIDQFLGKPRRS